MPPPPAVWILKIDADEDFSEYQDIEDVQHSYFLGKLRDEEGGWYRYRQRRFPTKPGSVVLFENDGCIFAMAKVIRQERYPIPRRGYRGRLMLDTKSIRVFDFVSADAMRTIWPKFVDFGPFPERLDVAGLPMFIERLTGVWPKTRPEHIFFAAVQRAGSELSNFFTPEDLRAEMEVRPHIWKKSYASVFQSMRSDEPGGAPGVPPKYRSVFRQVSPGVHALTDYGRELAHPGKEALGIVEDELSESVRNLEEAGYFVPKNLRDERKKRLREVVQRRGQAKFRTELLAAYEFRCAVTGSNAAPTLEAAHILPYSGDNSDFIPNGLLLRSDIHTLFDLDLIGIEPTSLTIDLVPELRGTEYSAYLGKQIRLPQEDAHQPNHEALAFRWHAFCEKRG